MSKFKIPVAAGAVLTAVALLSACSSSTKSTTATATPAQSSAAAGDASASASAGASASSSASDSAAAGASSAASGGTTATGTVLKTLLPTAATLPPGWKLDGDGSEFDTKDNLMDPGTPQLPQDGCKGWTNQSASGLSIDYRAAYASIDLTDDKSDRVNVVIASYHPGDAVKLLTEIRASADGCKSYQADAMGGGQTQMTLTDTPGSGLGDDSAFLKNVPQGHFVSQEELVARFGDKMLLLDGSDSASGALPDLNTLAQALAKNIK